MSIKIASENRRGRGVMYVCICRGVTVATVRAAVGRGAHSVDAVEAACGAGGDCGTCRAEIARIVRAQRVDEAASSEAA
jgi:bacterioferritin-associated ferredoxin